MGRVGGCCPGRGFSDKFGERDCCWGGRVGGCCPPRRPGRSCRDSCCYGSAGCVWRGVGAGSLAPLGVHPTCGSLCGEAGGGPGGPPSPRARGWGEVGSLCSAPLSFPAPPPLPRLPLPLAPVSLALAAPRPHPCSGPRAPGPDMQRGTGSRAGCSLTVRSGADGGPRSLMCVRSRASQT